jgi:hypothetical protein
MHRGIREFEAESSAHLLMNELELDTPEQAEVSRGYIQHWMATETVPEQSIRTVFRTVDTILKAGRLAIAGESEAA